MPERDLRKLLAGIDPLLHDGEWVFCAAAVPGALMTFQESEGTTSIVSRAMADAHGLPYSLVTAWITLRVHSDLAAVGFTAAFSTALAAAGIGCNVVAAFHHDHLFVPHERGREAVQILRSLAR
jgi:hypothetical protein